MYVPTLHYNTGTSSALLKNTNKNRLVRYRYRYLFQVASPLGVDALAVLTAELSVGVTDSRGAVQLVRTIPAILNSS